MVAAPSPGPRDRSLEGLRIAVTRPGAGSATDRLSELIREAGGDPVAFPLTRIVPPVDPTPLERAAGHLDDYDWIVFTSARAVAPFSRALRHAGSSAREVHDLGIRIFAVGPRTADALASEGLGPASTPDEFSADGVVEALTRRHDLEGARVLFPRAAAGREVIPEELTAAGARVDVVSAYRSTRDPHQGTRLLEAVRAGELDVLTFTSGSAVEALLDAGEPMIPAETLVIAIGPATAEALVGGGLRVDRIADPHSFEGLVAALRDPDDRRHHTPLGTTG